MDKYPKWYIPICGEKFMSTICSQRVQDDFLEEKINLSCSNYMIGLYLNVSIVMC